MPPLSSDRALGRLTGFVSAALVVVMGSAGPSRADVRGSEPETWRQHRVHGQALVVGATLLDSPKAERAAESATLEVPAGGVPEGARLVGAYVLWSASAATPDASVALRTPSGAHLSVAAERCREVERAGYQCRADVSAQVDEARFAGAWTLSGLEARLEGDERWAAWTLVLVWEAPGEGVLRDIAVHEGLLLLDETAWVTGVSRFEIGGFDVSSARDAALWAVGYAGDPKPGACAGCWDFLSVGQRRLMDASGRPENLFDSSAGLGLDVDRVDISGLVRPGQERLSLSVGSGDGLVSFAEAPHGHGERFLLGALVSSVARRAPALSQARVRPPEGSLVPGQRVDLRVTVPNTGDVAAQDVILRLGERELKIGTLSPGRSVSKRVPLTMPARAGRVELPVALSYRVARAGEPVVLTLAPLALEVGAPQRLEDGVALRAERLGDGRVRATLVVKNVTAKPVAIERALIEVPEGARDVRLRAGERGREGVFAARTLAPGEVLRLAFDAELDGDAKLVARVAPKGAARLRRVAPVEARGRAPAGALRVFEDVDGDGRFTRRDRGFDGFVVQLLGADERVLARAEAGTGGLARLAFPAGAKVARVLTDTGVWMADATLRGGAEQLIAVKPSGRVFRADSPREAGGARGTRLTLYYADDDLQAPGKAVDPADLGPGQQGQRIGAQGVYRFDAPAGRRYRVGVDEAPGKVAHDKPLLWAPRGEGKAALEELDIAVRPLVEGVTTRISLNKTSIRRGEYVTVTVEVDNDSLVGFVGFTGDPRAGILLRATNAPGLSYVPDSATWEVSGTGGAIRGANPAYAPVMFHGGVSEDGRQLFGMQLPAGDKLRFRYQLVAGSDIRVNRMARIEVVPVRAAVQDDELSERASVELRVEADPEFDESLVLGKVFCDEDGDGLQDAGELGLGGARVYGDHGYYADTDRTGKWHLKHLSPGNHLFKLDTDSLPPGSEPTTPVRRVLYLTEGLVQKVNFGVTCAFEEVSPKSVTPPSEGASLVDLSVQIPAESLPVVTVAGSTASGALSVDEEQLRPLKVDMSLAPPTGAGEPVPSEGVRNVAWTPGPLSDPLIFKTQTEGPSDAALTWSLRIYRVVDGGELLLRERFGNGAPPQRLTWDGTDSSGLISVLERGGLYRARLSLADGRGQVARSPNVVFGASYGAKTSPLVRRTLRGKLLDKRGQPTAKLKAELARLRGVFKDHPTARVIVEVHTDAASQPEMEASRTRRAAFAIREYFVQRLGVGEGRVVSLGYGGTRPLRPNFSEKNREFNRRIELTVLGPEDPTRFGKPPAAQPRSGVWVQGLPAELGEDGSFVRTVDRPTNGQIAVRVVDARGAVREAVVRVEPLETPESTPETIDAPVAPKPAEKDAPAPDPAAPAAEGSGSGVGIPVGLSAVGGAARVALVAADEPAEPAEAASAEAKAEGKAGEAEAVKGPPDFEEDPLRRFGGRALREAVGDKSILLDAVGTDGRSPTAGQLKVKLPPRGVKLSSDRLFVTGTTHPDNVVAVNGRPIAVTKKDGELGVFGENVRLPVGVSTLVITSTDPIGNVARLEWPVEVSDDEFFLMVLADGAFGQLDVRLPEEGPNSFTDISDGLFLHGRGAIYFKGRVSGGDLAEKLFITAHLDTARQREFSAFYEQVIDPTRDYAIFGDASEDVQDIQASGPLYLLVEADRSRLKVGNFKTQLEGIELLRYNRSFYGVELDLDHAFEEGWDTRVQGFVSDDAARHVRGHDEMRATGGSLYYLSRRDVIVGSERIHIVVREQDTRLEMARTIAVRDRDYRVDYETGRVSFNEPLSSTVDPLFTIGGLQPFTGRDILDGHEVWVVVDYETRGDASDNELSYGVHGSQTIAGILEVGAGYVAENRGTQPAYEMLGAHAIVKVDEGTRVRFEFAESLETDGASRISTDGGLLYQELSRAPEAENHGLAFLIDGESHVGKLLGEDLDLQIKGWYQVREAGFHAVGQIQEQGTEKFCGQIRYAPTKEDAIALRFDGTTVLIADDNFTTGFRAAKRTRLTGQYTHTEGRWGAHAEFAWGQYRDDADGIVQSSSAIAAGGSYRVSDVVQLNLTQEAIISGDDAVVGDELSDRMTTNFGAAFKVSEDTDLVAGQTVRWNGDNATKVGVRTRLSDKSHLFFEERFKHADDNEGMTHATVVGAETKLDKTGRAYGEYRLDSGVGGQTNRAVVGVGKSFELGPGVRLSAGYERTQSFGGYEGPGARDVLSMGVEILGADIVKYGGRYELRWDRADEAGGDEIVQAVLRNGLDVKITDDLTLLGVANYALVQNLVNRHVDRETLETTLGLAYRPIASDTVQLIGRWTRRSERRTLLLSSLEPGGEGREIDQRTIIDIASLAGIFELPFRLQLVEKVAYKHTIEADEELDDSINEIFLWINRLGFHLVDNLDIAVEYRLKVSLLQDDIEHGALIELAYLIANHARVGVGYNFTSFTDNLIDAEDKDSSGLYLRLTGIY